MKFQEDKFIQTAIKRSGILFLWILAVISCKNSAPIDAFNFLEGTWQREGRDIFETWEVKDGQLQGYGYRLTAGKEDITETLVIQTVGDALVYEATVPDQNDGQTISFALNSAEKDSYSFENADHDFPKKIQYQKINDSILFVRVRGEGEEGFSFNLLKRAP